MGQPKHAIYCDILCYLCIIIVIFIIGLDMVRSVKSASTVPLPTQTVAKRIKTGITKVPGFLKSRDELDHVLEIQQNAETEISVQLRASNVIFDSMIHIHPKTSLSIGKTKMYSDSLLHEKTWMDYFCINSVYSNDNTNKKGWTPDPSLCAIDYAMLICIDPIQLGLLDYKSKSFFWGTRQQTRKRFILGFGDAIVCSAGTETLLHFENDAEYLLILCRATPFTQSNEKNQLMARHALRAQQLWK